MSKLMHNVRANILWFLLNFIHRKVAHNIQYTI